MLHAAFSKHELWIKKFLQIQLDKPLTFSFNNTHLLPLRLHFNSAFEVYTESFPS